MSAPARTDGWHQPSDLPSLASAFDAVDGWSTDALILRAFAAIGTSRERLAFLGGKGGASIRD